eukprot:3213364-Pleurochrysis_carterae.AAC.1
MQAGVQACGRTGMRGSVSASANACSQERARVCLSNRTFGSVNGQRVEILLRTERAHEMRDMRLDHVLSRATSRTNPVGVRFHGAGSRENRPVRAECGPHALRLLDTTPESRLAPT